MADLSEIDADNELMIPLAALQSQFDCPICFCALTDTQMTPCGHNFCAPCIAECLNRQHHCPTCRAPTTRDQVVKNHAMDQLIGILTSEMETASRNYFANLISGAGGGGEEQVTGGGESDGGGGGGGGVRKSMTPIEQVFHVKLSSSLAAYNEYYSDLETEHKSRVVNLEREAGIALNAATAALPNSEGREEREAVMAAHAQAFEAKLAAERARFGSLEESLVGAYEAYLEGVVVEPSFVPLSVPVVVDGVGVGEVEIGMRSTVREVDEAVWGLLSGGGDGAGSSSGERAGDYERWSLGDVGYALEVGGEVLAVDGLVRPMVDPTSTLYLVGELVKMEVKCFSGMPFEESAKVAVDYFKCVDCNKKWICEYCSVECHVGHRLETHIRGHVPNWACCYCYRTKCCVLENVKTLKRKNK